MIGLTFEQTEIRAAIVTDGGDFVSVAEIPAPTGSYRDWLLAARDLVTGLDAQGDLPPSAVGIGLPAIIQDGLVKVTPLSIFAGATIERDLQSALGLPVHAYDLGCCLAAFEGRRIPVDTGDMIFAMWIGVSCHGGILIDQHLIKGANGGAGNWAHMQLPSPMPHEMDGHPCWCGRNGCLETFLSTTSLEADYERLTGEARTAPEIAHAAANSDIVADSVIQVFEDRLGRATASIINLLDPAAIVLGGSRLELSRLCERIPRKWPGYVQVDRSATRLIASQSGKMAAVGGAAMLAAQYTNKSG